MEEKEKYIYSYEEVEEVREETKNKKSAQHIIAQKGGQERMLACDADILIGGGSRGGSKPLWVKEKVVTPFGLKEIGELKGGDIISGLDGRTQRVIYNINKGKLPCYKLKFIDGSEVISSYDHAWNIREKLSNGGMEKEWQVWTTQMIVDRLNCKTRQGSLVIPICEPVIFTRAYDFKGLDSYILGALLGDGCFSDGVINVGRVLFSTMDKELVDEFSKFYDMSSFQQNEGSRAKDYIIRDNSLIAALKYFGLDGRKSKDKFIPKPFLYGYVDERFKLLRGLMDTDGTIDSRGHCSYSTISEQLAKDVKFLVNSLGGLATIKKGKAGYNKDGKFVRCNDVYNIYIRIKDSERIFNLTRKKERAKVYNGGISEYTRKIVGYEYVGERECCCIRVSNTDSLFLTNDFIVTHNTYSLLMEALYDIYNPNFKATLLRAELDDLSDVADTSQQLYSYFGEYNRSKSDMRWLFKSGGSLKFNYHADGYEDFVKRFQGKQFSYIGIDEITHIDFRKFKYLITCNRNAYGIKNRIFGTCNPDPESWVAKFIDWWLKEDGYPDPDKDGVVRYCFMDGEDVDSIYWGSTRAEVYEKAKDIIDRYSNPAMEVYGKPEELFIKSVAFVEAKLTDNKKLLDSDPTYLANLINQSEEQRARDLDGNWKFKVAGTDMIKMSDMENMFNKYEVVDDTTKYASCDAAFDGGDNLVMFLWKGWHIEDVFVSRLDSKMTLGAVQTKLAEWGVHETNFTYDLNGLGQMFKGFFPNAMPFNNRESVEEKFKGVYANMKSQAAYLFAEKIINGEISINKRLLSRKFSGNGFKNVPLADILQKERKAIRADKDNADKGFTLIKKGVMKKLVGHSPDFVEALFMRMIFELKRGKKNKKIKGLGFL